jgi:hypothetical protein
MQKKNGNHGRDSLGVDDLAARAAAAQTGASSASVKSNA